MSKAALIFLSSLVLMVALGRTTWAIQAKTRPSPIKISIRFAGYTNDTASGLRTALVEISNASAFHIVESSSRIVYHSPTATPHYLRDLSAILKAGEAQQVEIDAPTNGLAWRYEAAFEESENALRRGARQVASSVFPSVCKSRPQRQPFSSEWVSP